MSPKSLSSPRDSKTSEKQVPQTSALDNSFEEDDDDIGDQERLESLKELLFETYRIQNNEGINLNEFISDFRFVYSSTRTSDTDFRTLYQTQFKIALDGE